MHREATDGLSAQDGSSAVGLAEIRLLIAAYSWTAKRETYTP